MAERSPSGRKSSTVRTRKRAANRRLDARIGDLDPSRDESIQRTFWQLQRVGWGVMALVLLAGLLGLFGTGPLSRTRSDPLAPLWAEYDRFGRRAGSEEIRVYLKPVGDRADHATFWVDRRFLDSVQVERIAPEPATSRLDGDRVIFEFDRRPPASASRTEAVSIRYRPESWGVLPVRLGVEGRPPLQFWTFLYP